MEEGNKVRTNKRQVTKRTELQTLNSPVTHVNATYAVRLLLRNLCNLRIIDEVD